MSMRLGQWFFVVAVLAGLGRCADGSDHGPSGDSGSLAALPPCSTDRTVRCEIRSSLSAVEPVASDSAIDAVVAANDAFAFDLYSKTVKASDAVFSPLSVSLAFGMVWAAADGATKTSIASVFHWTDAEQATHEALRALSVRLTTADGAKLSIANAMWVDQGFSMKAPFLDTLASYYDAGVEVADFGDATGTAALINGWIAGNTDNRIDDIVRPGDVANARAALANAVALDAEWQTPFAKSATTDGPFQAADGTTLTLPFMHEQTDLPYIETADYQAVRLAYRGTSNAALEMVVVLPRDGRLDAVETALSHDWLAALVGAAAARTVELALPKFELRVRTDLLSSLTDLGFVNGSFAAASEPPLPAVGHVLHEAWVRIDEQGTKAAAATVVTFADGGVSPDAGTPVTLDVNRPFLFFIRDSVSGALLFVGKASHPTAPTT